MLLKNVYIRFYKSFNFDYLRKFGSAGDRYPWEALENAWYPFVRIPIERTVTTVVGANESGKSHLLSAIEKGLTGEGIDRADFCRYSKFFTVAKGERLWPEFGFEWNQLSDSEAEILRTACGLPNGTAIQSFHLFRTAKDQLTVYLRNSTEFSTFKVRTDSVSALTKSLPTTFHLDSKLALPSSVALRALSKVAAQDAHLFASLSRKRRFAFLDTIGPALKNAPWFQTGESVKGQADAIAATMTAAIAASRPESHADVDSAAALVKDLLFRVAGIDEDVFDDLYLAQRDGKDGHAIGLVEKINAQLATRLNFPKWWVQDKEFSLAVRSSDHDLVLTIRDRTGTAYSFDERSGGLKYFLSYYVQYLAHNPTKGAPEILLMDEPDAYLSSQAQQDLLKIFDAFANPTNGSPPIQVIYVTHSPFLIDKNHAERIRVLEKGSNDEGTRVVKDVSRNHYEPLRSAFGAFVGETTFIGTCNLMVEGVSDQILLAGAATLLRSTSDAQLGTLDLNTITLVPAGSASHVPYLVYLARGRDVEQPAVIVLLDSDRSGNDARKKLRRGGSGGKQVLADRFIMQIADMAADAGVSPAVPGKLLEIEDLVPIDVCAAACRQYASEICGASRDACAALTPELLAAEIGESTSAFEGIERCFSQLATDDSLHIEKVGFARYVCDHVRSLDPSDRSRRQFEANFKAMFTRLNRLKRDALRELTEERVSQKLKRHKKAFLSDHPSKATREEAYVLLETLEASLDSTSPETDAARLQLQKIRREFSLEEDMAETVPNFGAFQEAIEAIAYAGRISTQELDLDSHIKSSARTAHSASQAPPATVPQETLPPLAPGPAVVGVDNSNAAAVVPAEVVPSAAK